MRTNSESLIGARMPGCAEDFRQGIAIGSGIYIDEHTHIEAVRYPNRLGYDGPSDHDPDGWPTRAARIGLWLKKCHRSLLRHPIRTLRLFRPLGWARESVILLCMQALEGHIDMRWQRPWFWPFRKLLVSRGEKCRPTFPRPMSLREDFAQVRRGARHEHASGDPLRCSGHGTLHRRLRHRRFS